MLCIESQRKAQRAASLAERKQIVSRLLAEGKTQVQIARAIGVSPPTISAFIRRHKLKKRAAPPQEFEKPTGQQPLFKKCSCCGIRPVASGNRMLCTECQHRDPPIETQEHTCPL
jgi:hypothetical protein